METRLKVGVAAALIAATVVITWFVAGSASDSLRKKVTVENEQKARTLYRAAWEYIADHEKYPDASRWEDDLRPYLPNGFSAALAGSPPHRFAMNSVFSKRKMAEKDDDLSGAALFFESTSAQSSAHDALESLPTQGDTVVIAYTSGGVYAHPIGWVEAIKDPLHHKRIVGM